MFVAAFCGTLRDMTTIDLDAYLDRVRWGGDARVSLATLGSLLFAHVTAIPFDNLDVLLCRPVRLDLAGLQEKLVLARRGGYCFEHATLFGAVLERMGFRVARHAARVVLAAPASESPRGHMFLTVELPEGRFVVDPGFGGFSTQVPFPLSELARDGGRYTRRVLQGGKVADGWATTLEEDNPTDFEVANYYTSTHPRSPMKARLVMAAFAGDERVTVMNRDVSFWRAGEPRRAQLETRGALRALLVDHFGCDVPDVETMRVPTVPEWA